MSRWVIWVCPEMALKREDGSNWSTLLYSSIEWDASSCPLHRLRCGIGLGQFKPRRKRIIVLRVDMTAVCWSIAFEDSNSDSGRKLHWSWRCSWGGYFLFLHHHCMEYLVLCLIWFGVRFYVNTACCNHTCYAKLLEGYSSLLEKRCMQYAFLWKCAVFSCAELMKRPTVVQDCKRVS